MQQYPTQQLLHPKINLNPQALPQPPEFVVPCQQVMKYGPHMLYFLITNIQDRAESSPLRVLFFNVMAPNGFLNPEFDKLYKSAMAYLSYRYFTNDLQNVQNPVQDVKDTADWICAGSCANLVQIDQNLMQVVHPQLQQDVVNDIGFYQTLSDNVNQHMRMGIQPQQPAYGQPQAGYGQPVAYGHDQRPTAANILGGGGGVQPPQHTPFSTTTSMLTQQQYRNPAASAIGGRFDNVAPSIERPSPSSVYGEAIGQTTPQPTQQGNPRMTDQRTNTSSDVVISEDNETIVEHAAKSRRIWRPSDIQPNFPAINPLTTKLEFHFNKSTRKITAVPKKMDLNEHNIPYEQLRIADTFKGKEAIQPHLEEDAAIQARLEEAIERTRRDAANADAIVELTTSGAAETTVVRNVSVVAYSEDAVWYQTQLKRANLDKTPGLYRTYALVREPIIGSDNAEFIRQLGDADTYEQLVALLRLGGQQNVHPEVLASVNRRLTRLINDVVKMELSIPLDIDSFVADYDDLVLALDKQYGASVTNALRQGAASTIDVAFSVIDKIEGEQQFLKDNGEPTPVTYLNRTLSVTLIDVLAVELSVELAKETSAEIYSSENPNLYRIVRDILTESDADGIPVESHLIRTKDGVVLKATKGYFGRDAYQLSVVSL